MLSEEVGTLISAQSVHGWVQEMRREAEAEEKGLEPAASPALLSRSWWWSGTPPGWTSWSGLRDTGRACGSGCGSGCMRAGCRRCVARYGFWWERTNAANRLGRSLLGYVARHAEASTAVIGPVAGCFRKCTRC